MKVKKLIDLLKQFNPEAEVKLHEKEGNNLLFAVAYQNDNSVVVLEDKTDNDLRSEFAARFSLKLIDFIEEQLENGFTEKDIEENLPEVLNLINEFK